MTQKNRKGNGYEVFVFLFAIALSACGNSEPNSVYNYFNGVEIQCEDDFQKRIILNALEDMMTLSPKDLGQKRYPDVRGNLNKRDILTLIHNHFVPNKHAFIDNEKFYQELENPKVKQVLLDLIKILRKKLSYK